ncbi:unnamed protein product [Prorocentrum cordatum]|nr:unnamed protein product [Polarella glacialis]
MSLREQRSRLRPRTRPSAQHLEWGRAVLREGRLAEESRAIFLRHAAPARPGQGPAARALPSEALPHAAAELDAALGTCGSVCYLRHHAESVCGRPLAEEDFEELFWNMLWGVQKEFCQAVSREHAATRQEAPPRDAYRFERTLGSGTYGTVKLAREKATGARRAVKMISKSAHHQDCEIEHLLFLDHPHVVKLYEHYEDQSYVYLVMDYCSGGDLHSTISESRGACCLLPERFVSDVLRQVLMAIAHVHSHGIVHLDLKAANIMLTPSRSTLPPCRGEQEGRILANVHEKPHVMVIDLGVAQVFQPGNFRSRKPRGTPCTMAPEAWSGEFTPRADVWSCGVVLFELLALRLPFDCPCEHQGASAYWGARPAPPWARLRAASSDAVGMCRRMLVFDRLQPPLRGGVPGGVLRAARRRRRRGAAASRGGAAARRRAPAQHPPQQRGALHREGVAFEPAAHHQAPLRGARRLPHGAPEPGPRRGRPGGVRRRGRRRPRGRCGHGPQQGRGRGLDRVRGRLPRPRGRGVRGGPLAPLPPGRRRRRRAPEPAGRLGAAPGLPRRRPAGRAGAGRVRRPRGPHRRGRAPGLAGLPRPLPGRRRPGRGPEQARAGGAAAGRRPGAGARAPRPGPAGALAGASGHAGRAAGAAAAAAGGDGLHGPRQVRGGPGQAPQRPGPGRARGAAPGRRPREVRLPTPRSAPALPAAWAAPPPPRPTAKPLS